MKARPSRVFARILLTLMTAGTLALAGIYLAMFGWRNLFGDFPVFYEAARHAAARQWPEIYHIAAARAHFESGTNRPLLLFLNPPTALFLLYPLHLMSQAMALWVWIACQIVLLFFTLRLPYFRKLFAPLETDGIATPLLLFVAFAAFSLQCLLYGQATLFCTVLFLLVLAWRKPRPALAGVMLGLLSFKPQLGLLLPLLLLAERNFTALLWAVITACALALLSLVCFEPHLWRDYGEITALLGRFLARDQPALFTITSSFYSALRVWSFSPASALLGQGLLALTVIVLIWPVLRKGSERQKIVSLSLAAYLATPYALIYDMTLAAIPCAFLLRRAEADRAKRPELLALILLILMPVAGFLLQLQHIPYSVIAIGFALGVARSEHMRENP